MTAAATRHLISWKDWPDEEIREVLHLALRVKGARHNYSGALAGRTLVMLFQKTSTRTRVSFEAAMTELGGHAIFLDWNATNFKLTRIRYETAYLSRNAALIMARMKQHSDLLELRAGATAPLINGCCNLYHPCQAMADMLTIYEHRGSLQGARLTYIGVHNNVANSLLAICAAFGVQLTLVTPIAPAESVDQQLKQRLEKLGLLRETLDARQAVADAEYVYTDTWVDMEFFDDPGYQGLKEERIKTMLPYQLNEQLLEDSRAMVLHDMPIHPGYEISAELVESPRSLIFQQAENRLEAQKAIILTLLR
ncbi:MAG: ornithine carbamoyltransferase [Leptospirales bacterium]|nr:ornithine carbamoyltransferase [Leptospirales bacterium]